MTDSEKTVSLEKLAFRIYLFLNILGGMLTITGLLSIPSDTKNVLIFGLSASRLIMLSGVLFISVGASWLLIRTYRHEVWFHNRIDALINKLQDRNFWAGALLLCIAGVIGSSYYLLLTPEITNPFTHSYFVRLSPLLWWAGM